MGQKMDKRRYATHVRHLHNFFGHLAANKLQIKFTELTHAPDNQDNNCLVVTLSNGEQWLIGNGAITVEQTK